jgi:hypothetical protein
LSNDCKTATLHVSLHACRHAYIAVQPLPSV